MDPNQPRIVTAAAKLKNKIYKEHDETIEKAKKRMEEMKQVAEKVKAKENERKKRIRIKREQCQKKQHTAPYPSNKANPKRPRIAPWSGPAATNLQNQGLEETTARGHSQALQGAQPPPVAETSCSTISISGPRITSPSTLKPLSQAPTQTIG